MELKMPRIAIGNFHGFVLYRKPLVFISGGSVYLSKTKKSCLIGKRVVHKSMSGIIFQVDKNRIVACQLQNLID